MKTYIAVFLSLVSLTCVNLAQSSTQHNNANLNQRKINTIKKFYQEMQASGKREDVNGEDRIINKYADSQFKKAIRINERFEKIEDTLCTDGWQSYVWHSQDLDYNNKIKLSIKNNKVVAKIYTRSNKLFGTAYYDLKCTQSGCKITDIGNGLDSYIQDVYQGCR